MKITTTRLAELTKQRMVTRTEEANYKITTITIKRLQEQIQSKFK